MNVINCLDNTYNGVFGSGMDSAFTSLYPPVMKEDIVVSYLPTVEYRYILPNRKLC